MYQSLSLFRPLSEQEIDEYRASARANYSTGEEVSQLWHPAYRAECEQMNLEYVQSK